MFTALETRAAAMLADTRSLIHDDCGKLVGYGSNSRMERMLAIVERNPNRAGTFHLVDGGPKTGTILDDTVMCGCAG